MKSNLSEDDRKLARSILARVLVDCFDESCAYFSPSRLSEYANRIQFL